MTTTLVGSGAVLPMVAKGWMPLELLSEEGPLGDRAARLFGQGIGGAARR